MRNPTARAIRDFIVDGPTISPKDMSPLDRRLYRAAKRDYARTPSNQKSAFFRNLSATVLDLRSRRKRVTEAVNAKSAAQSVSEQPTA